MLCACAPTDSHAGQTDHQLAWYAVYTRHQHEKTVAQILTSKEFETLLPLYQTVRRWKDRTKLLSLPLFPCYVFLRGGLERRLDILTTRGIRALVSYAGQPAAIPPAEIEAIQRSVERGAQIEPHPFVSAGKRVRILGGSLDGIQGILVRRGPDHSLVVSVELLQRSVAIRVEGYDIELV